jgi:hypothetical protein
MWTCTATTVDLARTTPAAQTKFHPDELKALRKGGFFPKRRIFYGSGPRLAADQGRLMGGLTSADMAELAALDELFMPSTCTLSRTAPGTPNPDGSGTDGTVTTTTVACRVISGPGVEALVAGRLAAEADAVCRVPLGTDVLVTDAVTFRGVLYQIIDTNAGDSYATSIALTLKLVK